MHSISRVVLFFWNWNTLGFVTSDFNPLKIDGRYVSWAGTCSHTLSLFATDGYMETILVLASLCCFFAILFLWIKKINPHFFCMDLNFLYSYVHYDSDCTCRFNIYLKVEENKNMADFSSYDKYSHIKVHCISINKNAIPFYIAQM